MPKFSVTYHYEHAYNTERVIEAENAALAIEKARAIEAEDEDISSNAEHYDDVGALESIYVLDKEGDINGAHHSAEWTDPDQRLHLARRDMLNALLGILHHDAALKPQFKLPTSLIREVEAAVKKALGEV